jgi:hypothetical protein
MDLRLVRVSLIRSSLINGHRSLAAAKKWNVEEEIVNPIMMMFESCAKVWFCQQLIPNLKNTLESTKWNPLQQTSIALDVYEYLHQKYLQLDQDTQETVWSPKQSILPTMMKDDHHVLPSMSVDEKTRTTSNDHQQSFMIASIHDDWFLLHFWLKESHVKKTERTFHFQKLEKIRSVANELYATNNNQSVESGK